MFQIVLIIFMRSI